VWQTLRIRVRYESWTGRVERDLEPLGLTLKAGAWYLVAQVGGKPRTYRVSAIETLEVTEETFTRPAEFDLAAFWSEWIRDFAARLHRGRARLRLSPAGLRRLAQLAPAVAEAAARTAGPPDRHGQVEAEIPIESIDHAAGEILKLGAEAEVLDPPELRLKLVETAARLTAIYAPT
jgi:predicted DNA-binding transcriptional regulator YafY